MIAMNKLHVGNAETGILDPMWLFCIEFNMIYRFKSNLN